MSIRGNMDKWLGLLPPGSSTSSQIRFFDIDGRKFTGLVSRASPPPCGKIRIPLNESEGRDQPDRRVPEADTRARASSTSPSPPTDIYAATDASSPKTA
jgi:hypothetical protein